MERASAGSLCAAVTKWWKRAIRRKRSIFIPCWSTSICTKRRRSLTWIWRAAVLAKLWAKSSPVRKDEWGRRPAQDGIFPRKVYLSDGCLRGYGKGRKRRQLQRILLRRKKLSDDEAFEQEAYQILQMMMAECSRIFEKLPDTGACGNFTQHPVFRRMVPYEMIQKKEETKGCVTLIRYLACLRMRRRKKSKGISETEPDVSSGCQYQQSEQGAGGRKI